MKIVNTVKQKTLDVHVTGSVCGFRGDKLILDNHDLKELLKLSPDKLKSYLFNIVPRVVPVEFIRGTKGVVLVDDYDYTDNEISPERNVVAK